MTIIRRFRVFRSILPCMLVLLLCLLMTGCSDKTSQPAAASIVEKIPDDELAASVTAASEQALQPVPEPAPVYDQTAAPEPVPAETVETADAPPAASSLIPISSRSIFVGDSRTIDLFADSDEEIPGGNRDGITVFAMHGANYEYLQEILRNYDPGNYDMLISWMGANDRGDFERYRPMYESVLASGKSLLLLTVGPSDEASLKNADTLYYTDALITGFNASLTQWASAHGVPVIDLYTYIKNSPTVAADPADGVHYLPRPTSEVWQYFLSCTDR